MADDGRSTDEAVPPGAGWAGSIRPFDSPVLRIRYRGGVVVNPFGLPEWDLLARAMVQLPDPPPGLTVDEVRVLDVLAANDVMAATGEPLWAFTADDYVARTPPGWAWAHLVRTRLLALVPGDAYGAFRHPGGMATLRIDRSRRGVGVDDPTPVPLDFAERLTEDLLVRVEQRLGYRLPESYRTFLARTNGATPATPGVHPGFGFLVDQPLFGLGRTDRHADLLYANQWYDDRLTRDFLAIGPVQGGLLVVRVADPDAGSVWYWDDDDPRDDDRHDAATICAELLLRCADDLDAFWQSLSVAPRALLAVADAWVREGRATAVRTPEMGLSLPANRRPPDAGA